MRYVTVKLISGWSKPLWYEIPKKITCQLLVGSVVLVPFRNFKKHAVIESFDTSVPQNIAGKIRQLLALEPFPQDKLFSGFLQKVARFYFLRPERLYKRLLSFLKSTPRCGCSDGVDEASLRCIAKVKRPILTDEQRLAVDYVLPAIAQPRFRPTLLYGVTSSGKTEVYKQLIEAAIHKGKAVMFLLPEVALCIRFYGLLREQLTENVEIFSFHSATLAKEKRLLWKCLLEGRACLILGVHLPVLLPISNLGLIIVDEEHEGGFQEKSPPRLNSKELAVWRAKCYDIPIVLGSATPSISSLRRVKNGTWACVRLKKRFAGDFPKVTLASLGNGHRRRDFWLTERLERAIHDRLAKREQVIIFLNRRGHSFFVQCKRCGDVVTCKHCSVSLTLHKNHDDQSLLRCHYCGFVAQVPQECSECAAPSSDFLYKGVGTQRMVTILSKRFPNARVARADLDTTSKKRDWKNTVEAFYDGKIDIMVGTQTITKGYHFPGVTLVGIIWGDLDLNFPSFNAREMALQQLIQVAGRAGRSDGKTSEVIVQTLSEHSIFRYMTEDKYEDFCKDEFDARKSSGYPPFGRLVRVEIRDENVQVLEHDARQLVELLRKNSDNSAVSISILGPARPPVCRIYGVEESQILIKSQSFNCIHNLINSIDLTDFKSSVVFVPIL